jgi:hypothetical protein
MPIPGRYATAALCLPVLAAVLSAASGCGPRMPAYPAARLEGAVSVDGRPVGEGQILFMPTQEGQGPGVVANIHEGRYVAERVPLGKVHVRFIATKATGRTSDSGYGNGVPERVNVIPQAYRAGLTLEVSGDKAAEDFTMRTAP